MRNIAVSGGNSGAMRNKDQDHLREDRMDSNQDKNIEKLEPQDTGLIKQQGWMLTQIFCMEPGHEEETRDKALSFAKILSSQYKVAFHVIEDIEYRIIEIYRK